MKINEVISITGLSKQTLRYYEKESLINPARDANEYRNYNDDDIQILHLIKLLRDMNISIDDIKLVLNEQLSIQECLEIQEDYTENSIDQLNDVKDTIERFKDMNLPLIPALKKLDSDKRKSTFYLGYEKTTDTVSIGRRLTRPLLIKLSILYFIGSLLVSMFTSLILFGWILTNDSGVFGKTTKILIFLVITISIFIIQILISASGWGGSAFITTLVGTSAFQHNPIYFVEFTNKGIYYYHKGSILKQLQYFKDVLLRKDTLTFCAYKDIEKVIIIKRKRYVGIAGSAFSNDTFTYDFEFIFSDGYRYYLYNPVTLNNDIQFVAHILKHEIRNIEDPYEGLDTILNMNTEKK